MTASTEFRFDKDEFLALSPSDMIRRFPDLTNDELEAVAATCGDDGMNVEFGCVYCSAYDVRAERIEQEWRKRKDSEPGELPLRLNHLFTGTANDLRCRDVLKTYPYPGNNHVVKFVEVVNVAPAVALREELPGYVTVTFMHTNVNPNATMPWNVTYEGNIRVDIWRQDM